MKLNVNGAVNSSSSDISFLFFFFGGYSSQISKDFQDPFDGGRLLSCPICTIHDTKA